MATCTTSAGSEPGLGRPSPPWIRLTPFLNHLNASLSNSKQVQAIPLGIYASPFASALTILSDVLYVLPLNFRVINANRTKVDVCSWGFEFYDCTCGIVVNRNLEGAWHLEDLLFLDFPAKKMCKM